MKRLDSSGCDVSGIYGLQSLNDGIIFTPAELNELVVRAIAASHIKEKNESEFALRRLEEEVGKGAEFFDDGGC